MNVLSREKRIQIISALTEGASIRSTERLCAVHRDSIMRLAVRVGEGCRRLHHAMMRDLQVGVIELDEQWQYVGCKAKRVRPGEEAERGDFYLFVALGATNKAVISYAVGKRDSATTLTLVQDLRARVVNRPQITADGFFPYTTAVPFAFDRDVDFAQLIKVYQATPGNEAAVRYSPGTIRGIDKTVVCGSPDDAKISTSYIERFNLTTRMSVKRFARLSNGFSKKLKNHRAAVALQIAFYNLCRWHETIRCTPAMALGVTDHMWTIGELVDAALAAPEPPPFVAPEPPPPAPWIGHMGMSVREAKGGARSTVGRKLRVIKGGRS